MDVWLDHARQDHEHSFPVVTRGGTYHKEIERGYVEVVWACSQETVDSTSEVSGECDD